MVEGEIEAETHCVLRNVGAILNARGLTFDNVVKSTIFVSDMVQFRSHQCRLCRVFSGDTPPARETVQAAALPKAVNIEISVIATVN
jgi:2-iminobutanoate/2-iminopropanoate deaminase